MSLPGFFGKLPSRGDFVDRRLPHRLVQRLDDWIQESLALCMESDEDWEDAFHDSPCWRFTTGLGGDPPGLAGVILPSQDRVGRSFPLVLALPLTAPPGLGFPEDWGAAYQTLAALARETLDSALEPDDLLDRLARLPTAPQPRGGVIPAMQPGIRLNLQGGNLVRTLAAFPRTSNLSTGGLWWHHGHGDHSPCVLVSAGLPSPRAARHLWSDDWRDAPWRPIGQ